MSGAQYHDLATHRSFIGIQRPPIIAVAAGARDSIGLLAEANASRPPCQRCVNPGSSSEEVGAGSGGVVVDRFAQVAAVLAVVGLDVEPTE